MSNAFSTKAPKAPTPITPEKPQPAELSLSPTTQAFETERKRKGLLSTFLGGSLTNATNINRRLSLSNFVGGGQPNSALNKIMAGESYRRPQTSVPTTIRGLSGLVR